MPPSSDLGDLIGVYGPEPAQIQRAAFTTVLSFLFFLGTMLLYYARQSFLYFLLATAFLTLYIITLVSLVKCRNSMLQIFERGFIYKKTAILWSQIRDVNADGTVYLREGKAVAISPAVEKVDNALAYIQARAEKE